MDVIAFSRVDPAVDELEERLETGHRIYLQAPQRFQSLVDEFLEGLLPDESFLREISQRTGFERPREMWWVDFLFQCRFYNVPVTMVAPDLDVVLSEAAKELNMGEADREAVFQEARMWFLSGTGYIRHFYRAFNFLFSWLPGHVALRKRFLAACAWVVDKVPGDQQDVMFLVSRANGLMAMRLAERLKDAEGKAVLDEDIAGDVERLMAEL